MIRKSRRVFLPLSALALLSLACSTRESSTAPARVSTSPTPTAAAPATPCPSPQAVPAGAPTPVPCEPTPNCPDQAVATAGTYRGTYTATYQVPRAQGMASISGEIQLEVARGSDQVTGTTSGGTSARTPYGASGSADSSQLSGVARRGEALHGSRGMAVMNIDSVTCNTISGRMTSGPNWAGMRGAGASDISGTWSVTIQR